MSQDEFSTKTKQVSSSAIQGTYIDEFQRKMKNRLDMGARKYEDKSFLTDDILKDITEELLDVANYAYLLYERIKRLDAGERASNYLNFCNAIDLTYNEDRVELLKIFRQYRICHRLDGREYHYCKKGAESE